MDSVTEDQKRVWEGFRVIVMTIALLFGSLGPVNWEIRGTFLELRFVLLHVLSGFSSGISTSTRYIYFTCHIDCASLLWSLCTHSPELV